MNKLNKLLDYFAYSIMWFFLSVVIIMSIVAAFKETGVFLMTIGTMLAISALIWAGIRIDKR